MVLTELYLFFFMLLPATVGLFLIRLFHSTNMFILTQCSEFGAFHGCFCKHSSIFLTVSNLDGVDNLINFWCEILTFSCLFALQHFATFFTRVCWRYVDDDEKRGDGQFRTCDPWHCILAVIARYPTAPPFKLYLYIYRQSPIFSLVTKNIF